MSQKIQGQAAGSGAIYGLGFVGAFVYFISETLF